MENLEHTVENQLTMREGDSSIYPFGLYVEPFFKVTFDTEESLEKQDLLLEM